MGQDPKTWPGARVKTQDPLSLPPITHPAPPPLPHCRRTPLHYYASRHAPPGRRHHRRTPPHRVASIVSSQILGVHVWAWAFLSACPAKLQHQLCALATNSAFSFLLLKTTSHEISEGEMLLANLFSLAAGAPSRSLSRRRERRVWRLACSAGATGKSWRTRSCRARGRPLLASAQRRPQVGAHTPALSSFRKPMGVG